MGLDALLERLSRKDRAVTPVTPLPARDVAAKSAPLLACTPATPVTPTKDATAEQAISHRWLLHFADAEPLYVTLDPATTQCDLLARYPSALAAQPMPDPTPAPLPMDVARQIDDCIAADLYVSEDRELLTALNATDADATRALIDVMHRRIGRCFRCTHFSRPALSDGYCTSRADLPVAYGFMRFLPPGRGARCDIYKEST